MKRYIYSILSIVALFSSFTSCDEDGFVDKVSDPISQETLPWQATTNLSVSAVEGQDKFLWLTDLLSFEEYWGNSKVALNINLNTKKDLSFFTSVDFYIVAQEKDGYNYSPPFDTEGKLLKSVPISLFNQADGSYVLQISVTEVVNLFGSDFQNDRPNAPLLEGDIFEIYWKINSAADGYLDSREYLGAEYRYGFGVIYEDFAPPIWEGTFNYEYTAATSSAQLYGGISVGQTGSITFTHLGNQVYSVPNLGMSYYYTRSGTLTFDFLSGLVEVAGTYDEEWHITSVDGPTLYIDFIYRYSAGYDEYWSASLTRTDGNDWPTNIHTD